MLLAIPCNYSIELGDIMGDGWDGGMLSVYVNSSVTSEVNHTAITNGILACCCLLC